MEVRSPPSSAHRSANPTPYTVDGAEYVYLQIIAAAAAPLKGPLQSLVDSLTKKGTQDFVALVEKSQEVYGVECKLPDKSLER